MKLSPLYNAILAAGYICAVVLGIQLITGLVILAGVILVPIIILSLLVLSVAVMAFLFFYQPVRLLLEGNTEAAVRFFFATILIFAGTIVIIALSIVTLLLW